MASPFWLVLRIALIFCFGIAGAMGPSESIGLSVWALFFVFLWGVLTTRFFVFRSYTKRLNQEVWLSPAWSLSPFTKRQPFQFFHLVAISFVAFGLSAMLRVCMQSSVNAAVVSTGAFAFAFGLGILLGIKWAVFQHSEHFSSVFGKSAQQGN